MTQRIAEELQDLARIALRKARALPPGAERNELRQVALALKTLAENNRWLAGQRRNR
ncbi:hypothetical protein [Tardiphaga sp.]|jgi:hypothetical protein|uniref:hypothetical protein n=1 Tax=Tardiphaga sp. TaxID=1926292 RepID=UPI0037D99F45